MPAIRAAYRRRMQSARRVAIRLSLLSLLCLATPMLALAADLPPEPDSACAQESTFKSTDGTTKAALKVINNTDATVQTFWLDYKGARVFYQQVAPHASYVQKTWLTHPWIVASLTGECYRLVVMTSLEQVVTLNPGSSGVVVPPAPTIPPAVTLAPPIETFPPIGTPAPVGVASSSKPGDNGQGFPILPVAIGAAVVVAAFVGMKFTLGSLAKAGAEVAKVVPAAPKAPMVGPDPGGWEAGGRPRGTEDPNAAPVGPLQLPKIGETVGDDLDELGEKIGDIVSKEPPSKPRW